MYDFSKLKLMKNLTTLEIDLSNNNNSYINQ